MFRILKKPQGYIVEVEALKWTLFGLKRKWVPFVKRLGENDCWHHKTYDSAMMNLLDQIKWDTIKNTNN